MHSSSSKPIASPRESSNPSTDANFKDASCESHWQKKVSSQLRPSININSNMDTRRPILLDDSRRVLRRRMGGWARGKKQRRRSIWMRNGMEIVTDRVSRLRERRGQESLAVKTEGGRVGRRAKSRRGERLRLPMEVVGGVIETSLLWLVGQADIFCCCPEVAVLFLFSLLDLLLHFLHCFLSGLPR